MNGLKNFELNFKKSETFFCNHRCDLKRSMPNVLEAVTYLLYRTSALKNYIKFSLKNYAAKFFSGKITGCKPKTQLKRDSTTFVHEIFPNNLKIAR